MANRIMKMLGFRNNKGCPNKKTNADEENEIVDDVIIVENIKSLRECSSTLQNVQT